MKKIFVLDPTGVKLFEGTRQDAKKFIKKNAISRYRLVEYYNEKIAQLPEVAEPYKFQKLDFDFNLEFKE